jgi:hypothetical protein
VVVNDDSELGDDALSINVNLDAVRLRPLFGYIATETSDEKAKRVTAHVTPEAFDPWIVRQRSSDL